jgi:vacuolar protein sorting-associated protein 45
MSNQFHNLHEISNDYIENMISNIKEMKAMIYDNETQIMFSLEFSKSTALKQEIFLFENIEKIQPNEKFNLSGIFFLRPTEQNLTYLKTILENLNFKEIHLFFSNQLSDEYLQKVAQYDINMQVKTIQEVYFDYYVINSNVFHLNIESCISNLAMTNDSEWNNYDIAIFNRICEGLISICLSNRMNPIIKSVKNSKILQKISQKISKFFNDNYDFIKKECGSIQNGILFLYDRKEDPVTPLINQWTYQAQLHEIIGIKNNILILKGENGNKDEKHVLSDIESIDKFFSKNMNSDYGQVANEVQLAAEKLKSENQNLSNKENTIEELRKMIESLPERKKESMSITKHYKLFFALSEYVTKHKLMELSPIEQDISVNDDKKNQLNQINTILSDVNISSLDKAKIYLLYVFRYEGDSILDTLKANMRKNGLNDWVNYGDLLLEYAGKQKRKLDCLSNKDFLSKGKKIFMNVLKRGSSQNSFMLHCSFLNSLVEDLIKGKLKENEFDTNLNGNYNENKKPQKIIVFSFGGITFEETKDLTNLSKSYDVPIIAGGTNIINSKGFLAELLMLKQKSLLNNNDDFTLNIN